MSGQTHQGDPAGKPARAAAISLIQSALTRRGGIDEALSSPALSALEPRDRAFARALAMTTLRRLKAIDRALDAKLQRPPPDAVRDLLRIGAAQLFYMETPPHAAVSSAVEMADQQKATRPFKGLINAILRGFARSGAPEADGDLAPDWLMARWRGAFGAAEAQALAAQIAEEPAIDLSFLRRTEAEAAASDLEAEELPSGSWRTRKRGDLAAWPGYAEGRWWVQDAAAALPARLLGLKDGDTALDLCAAPGGKTLQMAAAGAAVTAVDRSAPRMQRVAENLERTGLSAEMVVADASAWSDPRTFDAVLLDAPCAATGTFRRHPEVLWAASPADIGKLAGVQSRLLDAAARRVRPGGRLVYCVCSLEPEEGEGQAAAFLKRRPDFRLVPVEPGEGGAPAASVTAKGTLRILPHHIEGGCDGFFAARFARTG